ncbi:MAG: choice-of-anchor J domain-containing protein [Bacteroidales bacterium]|nr:choice-of-anchor J domain-containing protein [Bacteroidales bacterium]
MRKFIFATLLFVAFAVSTQAQSGWTMTGSGLPADKGVGQLSLGMNDNTAMWGMAINSDGTIYDAFTRSTDGGNTWTSGTFNAGNGLSQLFAIDANTCWAVFNTGADQGLYKTTDGGVTWVKKGDAYGSGSFANVIHFFDDDYGFAQGDPLDGYYELYTTDDGGENWTRVDEVNIPAPTSGEYGITGNYYAIGDNIWFGTNQGRIFRSTDKGETWDVSVTAFGTTEVVGILMFDADNGISFRSYLDMGVEPELNETTDGGATWTTITTTGASFARFFAHIPGTTNTLVGSAHDVTNGEGISISYDGGYNWTELNSGFPFMASVWLDEETGWCGTLSSGSGTDGMLIYGETTPPPAPTGLEAEVDGGTVHLTWSAPAQNGLSDDFESYTDFALEFAPWTTLDVDGSTTYGMTGIEWPNAFDAQAFIIFNPSATTPAVTDVVPHSGDKLAACFASTTPDNDDWLIAPSIAIESGASVNFWAKSYTADYGLERFRVGVSTTGLDPSDFTIITPGSYVEAPADAWTEFNYSLDDYAGQSVYVGIQCVSSDAFILLVDDFEIGVSKSAFAVNPEQPASGKIQKTLMPVNYQPITQSVPGYKSTNALLGYNVYRDGSMINGSLVETEAYDDEDLPAGQYEYYVTAMYDEGESDPSNTVIADIITDVDELQTAALSVYPNPASDQLQIASGSKIVSVELISITGQQLMQTRVDENSFSMQVSEYNSGIYFLKVETESETTIQKITLK